jgi:anti-anti-sigma factor
MPQFEPPTQSQGRLHVRPFGLTERRIWPGCIAIEIEGELDFAVSDRLRAALEISPPCHVRLGFAACSFIDSSGLAVIVAAGRSLAEHDRQLLLYGVHGQVRRMLALTGLDPVLDRSFEAPSHGGESVCLALPGTVAA